MTPDSWEQRTIAELCEMVKGSAPISKTKEGQFPLVTTGAERKTADHYQFDAAAVCVPMISSTGHGHASLKRVHYQEGKFALANLLTALIVRDQTTLSPRFLHLYLNFYKDQLLVPLQAGAANMSMTVGRLATVPVGFPPLAEQKRILRILDEADELRRLRAQADRRAAALVPAIFHEMFGDPVNNAKNLPVVTLQQVCTRITDGTHQPPPFSTEGIPFLFVQNIVKGVIDFNTSKFITDDVYMQLTRHVRPERGDILYSTVGSYGVAVEVQSDEKFAFQRHIGHLKPNKDVVDPTFLRAQLNTPFVKSQADKRARGIAQKTINLAEIRQFQVLLPDLTNQQQFADRVAEVRALEESQAASRRKLDALFDSLLHRAFRGEL